MAKLQIIYDASDEVSQIIKIAEQHVDLKASDDELKSTIQKMFQDCFNEGRRFQKQITISTNVKDSVASKADI